MIPYKALAHIHSLNGEKDEITVLRHQKKDGQELSNYYIVRYGEILCTAVLNPFVGEFYADDLYGVVYDETEHP